MAESYDNPYQSPGFNYQDAFRPLDEPSRYDDFGVKSPEEAQMDARAWDHSTAANFTMNSLDIWRHQVSGQDMSFGDWQQRYAQHDPQTAMSETSPSQGLSMLGRLRELGQRIADAFHSQDRGVDL
jgi:hypothetical protein